MRAIHPLHGLLILVPFVFSLLGNPTPAAAGLIGPGSGDATISPDSAIVATAGTWTLVYDPDDNFTNGMLVVTFPDGWTPPQITNPTAPGYVTVSNNHTAILTPSVAGQVLTILIDDLPEPKLITIVYGDDGGGANPAARATPPTTASPAIEFIVESDPTGAAFSPITASPTINLKGGAAVELVFTNVPFTFPTTGEGGPYNIEARDVYGNASEMTADQWVDLSSSSGTGLFSATSGGAAIASVLMPAGTSGVSFFYADTIPGSPVLTASTNGQTWGNVTQIQSVVPGPPVAFVLSPDAATFTAGEFLSYSIDVVDAYGNPTSLTQNRQILLSSSPTAEASEASLASEESSTGQFFLPADHITPVTVLQMNTGDQTAVVDYRNTDANGAEPHLVIMLTDDGLLPGLSGTTNVTVQASAVHSAMSVVMSTDPEAVADGVDQSPVTVMVKDEFGNPVSGANVLLGVTGSAIPSGPLDPTNPAGEAQGVVRNETAEMVKVSATADGVQIADSATVEFVAGAADADSSSISAVPLSVTADGVDETVVTVTAKDALGNLISGADITLSINPPGNGADLIQPTLLTGPDGKTTGSLTSTATGIRTISATIDTAPINDTVDVDFVPGAADVFVWTTDGNAVAGAPEAVTLEVRDAQGNVITDYADKVYLSTTSSGVESWSPGGGASGTTGQDGLGWFYVFDPLDNGSAVLNVTVGVKETITLSATSGSASGTSGSIVVDNGPATQIEIVSGSSQTAVVNQFVANDLVVRVRDANNNLVDGASVTFEVVTGGGFVDVISGGPVENEATTNILGEATCQDWRLGTTTGSNTATAYLTGSPTVDVLFSATGTPGAGTQITLTPASQNVTVGTDAPAVEATLVDTYGNAVPNEQVSIVISDIAEGLLKSDPGSTNPTSGGTTFRNGLTDSNGQISVLYQAPATAGLSDTIDAFGDQATGAVSTVTFTSVVGQATLLRITGPTPNPQNAGQTFSFLVEAVDGTGNLDGANTSTVNIVPEAGSGLVFSASDFGAQTTQFNLAGGQVTVYGRGFTTGSWDFTSEDDAGVLGSDAETIEITDTGVIATYAVSTVAGVVAGASFTVNVTAKDDYGNTVAGANGGIDLDAVDDVSQTELPADEQLSVRTATLISGQASVAEMYTTARNMKVRVSGAPGSPGYSGVVIVSPNVAHHLVQITPDLTGIVAGSPTDLVSEVQDLYDNPVPGQSVAFAIVQNPGGATLDSPSDISDGVGRVSVELTTGATTGLNRVRASFDNGTYNDAIEFDVTTQASTTIAYYLFSFNPNKTTWTAGESISVTVQAYDTNDNPVNDNATTVVFGSTTGTPVFTPASGQLSGGAFTTSVHDNLVEQVQLTVNTGGGPPASTSSTITIIPAGAYEVTKTSGDGVTVEVGSISRMEVSVFDEFGNAVPGEPVNFVITVDPDGTAFLTDGEGAPGDGITSTDPSGVAWVDLNTSGQAGIHNILSSIDNGNPPALETKTFTVTTAAGAIASYEIILDATTETAGVPLGFTVRALDTQNNLVTAATNFVDLRVLPGGATTGFGTNPIQLSGGEATTTLAWETSGIIQIEAETQGGGVTGVSDPITVVPGIPGGTIVAAASPDTITANGVSQTTVVTETIRDDFGNKVASGTLVTVSTNRGTIISDDVDPAPGHQRATGANGLISLVLRSSVESMLQTATVALIAFDDAGVTGTAAAYFAPKPNLVAESAPVPAVVSPGGTLAFEVDVRNTSVTDVRLLAGTIFKFSDGVESYASTLVSDTWVLGGQTQTLVFSLVTIDANMDPGQYTPVIDFAGQDQYLTPFEQLGVSLPANSLRVTAIQITGISAESPVSRGQTGVITVGVENLGPIQADITSVTFDFSNGGEFYSYTSTLTPSVQIPGFGSVQIPMDVMVLATCETGTHLINAAVAGTVDGVPVSDPDVSPNSPGSWTIVQAAALAYVNDTLDPTVVTSGRSFGFSLGVQNSGQATVTLNETTSFITFNDGTGNTYTAGMTAAVAIGGGAEQTIDFNDVVVPVAFTPGNYPIAIHLEGLENGGSFATDISTGDQSDSVSVVTDAAVAYGANLDPDIVSKQTSISFSFDANNTGGADLVLIPDSTQFWFDGKLFNAPLDAVASEMTIPGEGSARLTFRSTLVTSNAGPYTPRIRVVGYANGYKREFMLTAQAIEVLEATTVAIVSTTPSQDQITQNQTQPFTVTLAVQNNGGAAVRFDSTRIEFIRSGVEETDRFVYAPPTQFDGGATLSGGSGDNITFDITSNSSPPAGNYTIEGIVYMTNLVNSSPVEANTSTGGKGALLVELPGVLEVVDISPSQATVTQDQNGWQIRMTVRNSGEAALDLQLPGTAALVFAPSNIGWAAGARASLEEGGVRLDEGEEGTVVFDVISTGTPDLYTINGGVTAEDVNSSVDTQSPFSDPSSEGNVTVTAPASVSLAVDAVPTSVTTGFSTNWEVLVDVTNSGGSDIQVDFASSSTRINFVNSNGFAIQNPVSLEGGGDIVPGNNQTRQLKFVVTTTGAVTPMGAADIGAVVRFADVNTAIVDSSLTTVVAAVLVQERPVIAYVDPSLTPNIVSRGQSATFALEVENTPLVPATLTLDPTQTRLRFGSGLYNVTLDPSSDKTINGGGSTTLRFNSLVVDTNITAATYTPQITLVGTENGNPYGPVTIDLTDALAVENPSALEVQDVIASVPTATSGQANDWTITLVVKNNGQAAVDLDLDATEVRLFKVSDTDKTDEYDISKPTKLEEFPDARLPGDSTGTLVFTVNTTGVTTGTMVLRGHVEGIDENSLQRVTGDGVGGSVIVQTAANLVLTGVTASRATVTENQTNWTVTMAVENTGQATLDLDLSGGTVIEFAPANAGWTYTPPPAIEEGGTELGDSESGTLVFDITGTGPAGIPPYVIGGRVNATERNRQLEVSDTTDATTEGAVIVQTPGAILITGITRSQEPVTQGQDLVWTVGVGVINDGEAAVLLSDDPLETYIEFTNGTPALFTGPTGALSLDGGGATTLTFAISPNTPDFGDQFGPQPFTAHIEGTELNRDVVLTPAESSDSVEVELRPNPTYIAGSLLPRTANAGEPARFRVRVSEIAGAAILGLDPDRTKFSFTDGQTTIQPRLDAAMVDSIFADGDTTLYFEEVLIPGLPNPFLEGSYEVTVDLVGDENGNPYSKTFTLGSDRVTIGAPSDVEIVNMTSLQSEVTAGQGRDWEVRMTVRNKGAATLELQPSLTKLTMSVSGAGDVTDEYTISSVAVFQFSSDDSLRSGVTDTLVFYITQTGSSTGTGALRVDGTFVGKDVDADKNVSDNTSNAGWIDMLIQTPADLNVAASITSPSNADTLSTEQPFVLTALVTNDGQSTVDNTGTLTLTAPAGFVIDPGTPATQSFVVGSVVLWDITAPAVPASGQLLDVEIDNRPLEVNSGRLAEMTDSISTVAVEIVERAGFTPTAFDVKSPDGAMDDTVSTDQRYIIEAKTLAEATTTGITATLQILSGDEGEVIDPIVRPLGDGDGGEKVVEWRIDAPATPDVVLFRVRYTGFDENSSENIDAFSDTLKVTTVDKARLQYTANITSPNEARDGSVAFGTVFDIEATVINLGGAAVDTLLARLTIDFTQAPEYDLDAGVKERAFVVGEPITWQVIAPNQVTQPRIIRILMSSIPDDENTGAAAVVISSPVPIAIQTETNAVTVDDISQGLGLDTKVVPKGTSDIDMLAIEVANPDASAEQVRIDSFRVTLLDKNGREVGNPSATLSEFYVNHGHARIEGVVTQNPMIVNVGGVILNQEEADSFVFVVSVANNAQLDEIVLSFHGSDAIAVKEVDSGQPVNVVDKDTGQLVNGRIRSQPLVILSDQFEEYAHNYPNPFRAGAEVTRIAYIMESDGPVSIRVFDITGELVYERQYGNGDTGTRAGPQELTWDGRNLKGQVVRNGMYICQIEAGSRSVRIKMAVAK